MPSPKTPKMPPPPPLTLRRTPTPTSNHRKSINSLRSSTPTKIPQASTCPKTRNPKQRSKRFSHRPSSIPRVRMTSSTTIATTKTTASSVTSVTSPSSSTWSSFTTPMQNIQLRQESRRRDDEVGESQTLKKLHRVTPCTSSLQKTASIEEEECIQEQEDAAAPPSPTKPTPLSPPPPRTQPDTTPRIKPTMPKSPLPPRSQKSEPRLRTLDSFRTLDLLEQKWKSQKNKFSPSSQTTLYNCTYLSIPR
mmetsp:Transcript_28761/g.41796  ORF Transcript_28761/g.41796 Transcript_28761/m.41796 type:complete len:249 (-) Transcript_28761:906-1652(-)